MDTKTFNIIIFYIIADESTKIILKIIEVIFN